MQRLQASISTINFGLAIFLAMIFIFNDKLEIPSWLYSFGRMHVMILHLPIGIFSAYILLMSLKNASSQYKNLDKACSFLLAICVSTALIAAIFGMFLGTSESEYDVLQLKWHKYSGVAFVGLLFVYSNLKEKASIFFIPAIFITMIIAGHKGAEITHGKEYIFPNRKNADGNVNDNQSTYAQYIEPVLEKKCFSCHNDQKAKGKLILTDSISFLKGGENGQSFIVGNADSSLIIKYIHLPLSDDLHMPPQGKPQLTNIEKQLLREWINHGASFNKKKTEYSPSSTFVHFIDQHYAERAITSYTFSAVDKEVIAKLNTPFRSVSTLYQGSPAIQANYLLEDGFSAATLKDLHDVKSQLVSLNLSRMPLKNEDLKFLAPFISLEKLILNDTELDDISNLPALPNLKYLSLMNTRVTVSIENKLKIQKSLSQLYLNGTKIDSIQMKNLRNTFKNITIHSLSEKNELIRLTMPLVKNEKTVLEMGEKIALHHYIKGVVIKYTTDGSLPSTTSAIYKDPIPIDNHITLKAIAIKEGWMDSEVYSMDYFIKGITPDSFYFNTNFNSGYIGKGNTTPVDGLKGPIINLKDSNWIAFREEPLICTATFDKPTTLSDIIFCYGVAVPPYVFPPKNIKVYGGNDIQSAKLIHNKSLPEILQKDGGKTNNEMVEFPMDRQAYKYIRIEAYNLPKIPSWHPGKGEKGWLFLDEIFFYK